VAPAALVALVDVGEADHMLGQTTLLAEGLWFVQGEMPENVDDAPDWCNVVIYRKADRLYLVDSSGGTAMRDSIERVLREVGPVRSATLVNTHAHLDHICNNDLIGQVPAAERHHYLGRGGTTADALDAPRYFAAQFDQMDTYADPFASYPVNRGTYRLAGWIRDGLGLVVGRRRVLGWLFGLQFKKFRIERVLREVGPVRSATLAPPWRRSTRPTCARSTSPVGHGPGGPWARARSCCSRPVPTATTTSWSTCPSTGCCAWGTSRSRSSPPGRTATATASSTACAWPWP
jgi:hypothetical protein